MKEIVVEIVYPYYHGISNFLKLMEDFPTMKGVKRLEKFTVNEIMVRTVD